MNNRDEQNAYERDEEPVFDDRHARIVRRDSLEEAGEKHGWSPHNDTGWRVIWQQNPNDALAVPGRQPLAWLPVVALALYDGHGRVLLQERLPGKRHAGCWELPGGKVEPGETPRAALVREVAEELAIVLDPADLVPVSLAEEEGDPPIILMLYETRCWRGEIAGLEGQAFAFHTRAEAARLDLAPTDRALLARLAA